MILPFATVANPSTLHQRWTLRLLLVVVAVAWRTTMSFPIHAVISPGSIMPKRLSPVKGSSLSSSCSSRRGRLFSAKFHSSDTDNNGYNDIDERLRTSSLADADMEDSSLNNLDYRKIVSVQRFARLPVWPAWNGVLIWMVQKVLGESVAAQLEHVLTGRVCPNFFEYSQTSPFIMLVHHCHSFAPWDPLRWFQRSFILAEGFPAHPHRGFVTLTYFLAGGFVHRDSMGIRQTYGASSSSSPSLSSSSSSSSSSASDYNHHSQWLQTGAGVLHEEMFDITKSGNNNPILPIRQELYQLWINLPSSQKLQAPFTVLLNANDTPLVVDVVENLQKASESNLISETLVLAGSYKGRSSSAPIASDMMVLHVRLYPNNKNKKEDNQNNNNKWTVTLPHSFQTAFLYVRQGSLVDSASGISVPAHSTAYFDKTSSSSSSSSVFSTKSSSTGSTGNTVICLENSAGGGVVADFMFLAGVPLKEPCVAQGSMVMNSFEEINQAYADYQRGMFGRPWDHKLSDAEWRKHVQAYPSQYSTTPTATRISTSSTSKQ